MKNAPLSTSLPFYVSEGVRIRVGDNQVRLDAKSEKGGNHEQAHLARDPKSGPEARTVVVYQKEKGTNVGANDGSALEPAHDGLLIDDSSLVGAKRSVGHPFRLYQPLHDCAWALMELAALFPGRFTARSSHLLRLHRGFALSHQGWSSLNCESAET